MLFNRRTFFLLAIVFAIAQYGLGAAVIKPAQVSAASAGPTILSVSPSNTSTNVPLNAKLVLTFDEEVAKGSGQGAVEIRELGNNNIFESYTVATDSRVSINASSKNVVTITPSDNFKVNTRYYVYIDPGAFVNVSNNANFSGLSSTAAWNFTTVPRTDTTAPEVSAFSPKNGGTGSLGTSLKITFNEPVFAAEGNVTINNVNNGSDAQTFPVVSGYVTGSATQTIVIRPPASLQGSSTYEVTIPSGAFQDGSGNDFSGIASGQWRFQTSAPPLGKPGFSPADNAYGVSVSGNFAMTFATNIAKGSGLIRINKIADNSTVQSIDVNSSNVTISGKTAVIDPSVDLSGNTEYYILVDSGAFVSAGNSSLEFEGIADAATWNFFTDPGVDTSAPTLLSHTPDSTQTALELSLKMTFSEPVFQGSGSIVIKTAAGGVTVASVPVTSSKVSGGGTATITVKDSSVALINNTEYTVQIGGQAFHDASGNPFAGLSGRDWTFTVTQDKDKPAIVTLDPLNNAENVMTVGTVINALFTEPVRIAKPDGVKIKKVNGKVDSDAFDTKIAVDSQNNRMLKITVDGTLEPFTNYYVEMAEGVVADIAGNHFDGILNQYQWTFKTVNSTSGAPVLSKAELVGNSKIVLTFNEALDPKSKPQAGNFYVTVNGAGRTVSSIQMSGQTISLNLTNSIDAGQEIRVSYSPGANPIKDLSGTEAASFSNKEVDNSPDTTAPAQLNGAVSGNRITLTYSEEIKTKSSSAYNQFSVYVNGSYRSSTGMTYSGSVVYLTFDGTPVKTGDSVTLSYSGYSNPITDLAGNEAASFSGFYIQNGLDTKAPVLQNVLLTKSLMTLVYDEALNPANVPLAGSFTVYVNGSAASVTSVTVLGAQVLLTLSSEATDADTVVVSYKAGTPAIADFGGNAAESFTNRVVNGNGDYSATTLTLNGIIAKGQTITISFSSVLNTSYVPYLYQFTVKANQSTKPLSDAVISGSDVVLTLMQPIAMGDSVTVGYSASGVALRSMTGIQAASFTDVNAANQTTWDDNVSGDFEAAAGGGVGIKSSAATTVQDVSPGGKSATRYQLSAEKLATAFNTLTTVSGIEQRVVFTVPGNEKAGLVSVSLSALNNARNVSPTASFVVVYNDASYELPLSALDYTELGKMMNAGGAVGQLLISIDTNATSLAGQLTSAARGAGAQIMVSPVSFQLAVTDGGQAKPIDAMKGYTTRTIVVTTSLDPLQTAVVWLDPATSKLSYAPTHVESANGQSVVTFQHKGNSVYAVIKASPSFTDLTGHWAEKDVLLIASKMIAEGRSAGKFEPDKPVTRGEFAAFIVKGLGLPGNSQGAAKFKDVDASKTEAAYIGAAANAGIVQGMPDGTFQPNSLISREQMSSMMIRAASAVGVQIVPAQSTDDMLNRFKDSAKIGVWAQSDAAKAVEAGIINGMTANTFAPKANATRAQAAVMVKRLLEYVDFIDS